MIRNLKNSFLNFKTVSPQVNKTFSVYTDYLNPEKHIYMSHNPDNIYQDIYQIGEYPMPQRLMIKEISKVYIPQIRTLVFDHLQKIYVFF